MPLGIIKLGLVSFFTDISSEMIYPFLGIYFSILGATPLMIGFIEGIAEGVSYFIKMISGGISDYWKKRKYFTLSGYSISAFGKLMLYIGNQLLFVSLGRWLDRMGKGIRNAPRDAWISELSPEKKKGKAFGFHRFMDTLGALIGVLITYMIFNFLLKNGSSRKEVLELLIVFSMIPALMGIFILFTVKESENKEQSKKSILIFIRNSFIEIRSNRNLLYFLFFYFIFALSNSSDQFIFLKADAIEISEKNILISYFFYNISYVLFSFPSGWLSDKIHRKYIIGVGYIIYSCTYFLIPQMDSFFHLLVIFSLYGVHKGISEGTEKALISDYSQQYRASIYGLQSVLYGIGIMFASFLGGIFWEQWGSSTLFYVDSFLSLLAGILIIWFLK